MTKNCRPGEIWLAKYAFEDAPDVVKIRPVLVYEIGFAVLSGVKLTGKPPRDRFEFALVRWNEAGLSKPTIVRTAKSIPLRDEILIRKIGDLQPIDLLTFRKKLEEYRQYLSSKK